LITLLLDGVDRGGDAWFGDSAINLLGVWRVEGGEVIIVCDMGGGEFAFSVFNFVAFPRLRGWSVGTWCKRGQGRTVHAGLRKMAYLGRVELLQLNSVSPVTGCA